MYHNVSLTRTVLNCLIIVILGTDAETNSSHCLDERDICPLFYFAAQVPDVNIHYIRVADKIEIPDVFSNLCASQNLTRMTHQVIQQCKLARTEIDEPSCPPYFSA